MDSSDFFLIIPAGYLCLEMACSLRYRSPTMMKTLNRFLVLFGLLLFLSGNAYSTTDSTDVMEAEETCSCVNDAVTAECVIEACGDGKLEIVHDGPIRIMTLPNRDDEDGEVQTVDYETGSEPPQIDFAGEIVPNPVDLSILEGSHEGRYEGYTEGDDLQIMASGFMDIVKHGQGSGAFGKLSGFWASEFASVHAFFVPKDMAEGVKYKDTKTIDPDFLNNKCGRWRRIPGIHGAERVYDLGPTYQCEFNENETKAVCYKNFRMSFLQDCRDQSNPEEETSLLLFRGIGSGRAINMINVPLDLKSLSSGALLVITRPNNIFLAIKKL